MAEPTAREVLAGQLEHRANAAALLDAYEAEHRDQVLAEAAARLDRIADEAEARVAAYYGPASGIGPGSADMVRECARTLRGLAARTTPDTP